MHHYGLIQDDEKIISKWGISEHENGKELWVQAVGQSKELFLIDVIREPNETTWKEASINGVSPKGKENFVFMYQKNGGVTYASSERIGWQDNNKQATTRIGWQDFDCDGQFDLRTDFRKKLTEFYVNDRWVKVHYKNKQATTDEGLVYKFDSNDSEWKAVKSNNVNSKP